MTLYYYFEPSADCLWTWLVYMKKDASYITRKIENYQVDIVRKIMNSNEYIEIPVKNLSDLFYAECKMADEVGKFIPRDHITVKFSIEVN